jgi:hypothetical protein
MFLSFCLPFIPLCAQFHPARVKEYDASLASLIPVADVLSAHARLLVQVTPSWVLYLSESFFAMVLVLFVRMRAARA